MSLSSIYSLFFCLIIIINAHFVQSAPSSNYSFADLKSLEKTKSYKEYLKHTLDILPSQRNEKWEALTKTVIEGFIDNNIERKKFDLETFKFTENISSWKISHSAIIQYKRITFGLIALENCFKNELKEVSLHDSIGIMPTTQYNFISENSSKCFTLLNKFWQNTPKNNTNHSLAIKLGNIVSKYLITNKIWDFFIIGTKSKFSEFYCKQKNVQKIAKKEASKILALRKNGPELVKKSLLELANENCWIELTLSYQNDLFSKSETKSKNAFNFLVLFHKLTELEKDLFHTLYLLRNPMPGKTFNNSWRIVTQFGQNYLRRQKVFKKLISYDPLPGAIFKNRDSLKSKTVVTFLATYFPEYIDFYAKTCIDYLKGNKNFPNGNPTMECHQLFKISKNTNAIGNILLKEYKNITSL